MAENSPERSRSLNFRFTNEDIFLERASERPLFGWGGWGRNRIYDKSGRNTLVKDGHWVSTISTYGWVGYLAEFGLLTLGMILLTQSRRLRNLKYVSIALSTILAVSLLDMLLNSSLTPLTWLIAGALLGRAEQYTTMVVRTIQTQTTTPKHVSISN